jgi:ASC-1-like (ASCH) protein
MNTKETKKNIILAGQKAVEELIKVAKEKIVESDDDLTADKLKNAAATKKLAIFDAFEILSRIEAEEQLITETEKLANKKSSFSGFAEGRSK